MKKKTSAKKPAAKKATTKKSVTAKAKTVAAKKVPAKKGSSAKKETKKAAAPVAKKVAAKAPASKTPVVDSIKKFAAKVANKISGKSSLVASAVIETLKAGAAAPQFRLPIETGAEVSLKDYAGKTVILYFYPKDDTPGCTKESCDFRDSFSRVQAKGAVVLGVSKDSVKSHQKFKEKFGLPFSLISDESGKMLEAYRVWKEKSMYGKKYMGVDRTTYLIDVDAKGNGKIRKVYPQVKVEGHVDQILKDLN